jgi:aminoglycoside N3'-acetyltransferase
MTPFARQLAGAVAKTGTDFLLVHADVFRARSAIEQTADAQMMLARHMQALEQIADKRSLWLPAFNYDFTSSHVYDVQASPSQVGPLTEYARSSWATWRAGPPVFNFSGNGVRPSVPEAGEVDPFSPSSHFAMLHKHKSSVLMYGARFANFTCIHYIERLSGGPVYRYDKHFAGKIRDSAAERDVVLTLHCRPYGKTLEYDWARLRGELEGNGIVQVFRGAGSEVLLVDFPALVPFWLDRISDDPLYLLDSATRAWVEPELERLGRRFLVSDFEQVE